MLRRKLVFVLLVLATACNTARTPAKKVIVLGIDGMDPGFVKRHWADLPNLRRLSEQGSYARLGTTTPPQSPVAWSTFITGLTPAQHGIFDFVHRDPATLGAVLVDDAHRGAPPHAVRGRLALPAVLGPHRLASKRCPVLETACRRGHPRSPWFECLRTIHRWTQGKR